MEMRRDGETRKVSRMCLLLLGLLQITTPSSAENNKTSLSYLTRPADIRVPVGDPAVFRCGVPQAAENLTFTFHQSQKSYNLTCPNGHNEEIALGLYGTCDQKDGELLAVWNLKGTSFSDNGTTVVCQQSNNPEVLVAVLHVYDDGLSYAILIGCTIGGFFGTVLVAGLTYIMVRRSVTLQECFKGKEEEDDMNTIVTKE
ncbi:hypothetical protein E3U43_020024 [Larimichthys crocea]|uniref:Uncharacterized protein n=1 Tax=Larimichthys crocea TaxID=215358 RepID=A0ACD3QUT2_LARCR|nr:hypothetical protein E3U43_020024 [Larimichthys crocea]